MKIHFYLRFSTRLGQSLSMSGNVKALGNNDIEHSFSLKYLNKEFWEGEIELDPADAVKIQYQYILLQENGISIMEWNDRKQVDISKSGVEEIQIFDTWCDTGRYENVFYTDPFQKVLLKENQTHSKIKSPKTFTHIFKVKAPLLNKNEVLCLSGNSTALGNWDQQKFFPLTREDEWWSIKLNLPNEDIPLSYKYGVYNTRERSFIRFETGENRLLHGDAHHKKLTVLHDGFVRLPNDNWKGAGVSVPVFSLRSKNSFGVGEFTDLKLLSDWAKKAGLKLIQILPVNDTIATHSWVDSYPYASISAFALHPVYLNLEKVAGRKHADLVRLQKKSRNNLTNCPTWIMSRWSNSNYRP